MKKLGFLVNPIAGMGGKVALKGTDGVSDIALKLGAVPVSQKKALEFIDNLDSTFTGSRLEWHTASGEMGADVLSGGKMKYVVDYTPADEKTSAEDTRMACECFVSDGCELIVFVGGDGTARDVHFAVRNRVPIIGIPSGVKMHSAVFTLTPKAGAELILDYMQGAVGTGMGEILDLDEELYRRGEWHVRLFDYALTLAEPSFVQSGKMMIETDDDAQILEGIAENIMDDMRNEPDTLYIFGPGSTTKHICDRMGIEKTMLGVDAVARGGLVGKDLTETGLLRVLEAYDKVAVVVSPIGSQGFILGRGNLQISERVLDSAKKLRFIVVSTPAKLARTPVLRADSRSARLKEVWKDKNHIFVITGRADKTMRKIDIVE